MMASDSDEDLIIESPATKWFLMTQISVRECQVHSVNRERKVYGEYHHLYKKLRKFPKRFHEYLRMDVTTFDYILCLVSPRLQKKKKKMEELAL